MRVSKNFQIQGICISGALFLFYAPKILKPQKIILSFPNYHCFNAKFRTEVRNFCLHLFCQCKLVEVGGIEPPSESTLTGFSPGADGHCGSRSPRSPSKRQAVKPSGRVSFMMCGTGKAYRTHIYR